MPEPERRGGGFTATALIVLGLLILIPSGLCTGAMTIFPLLAALANHGQSGVVDTITGALMIGGPFVLLGGLLTWAGYSLRRR